MWIKESAGRYTRGQWAINLREGRKWFLFFADIDTERGRFNTLSLAKDAADAFDADAARTVEQAFANDQTRQLAKQGIASGKRLSEALADMSSGSATLANAIGQAMQASAAFDAAMRAADAPRVKARIGKQRARTLRRKGEAVKRDADGFYWFRPIIARNVPA
jgi:hypothetical protein